MINVCYSDMITRAIMWAEDQEVEGLGCFFMDDPNIPLVAVGSGSSLSVASYASLLYSTRSAIGRAITPLSVNTLSDATLMGCKVLLISASGHNEDITYLADRLVSMKHPRVANLSIKDGERNQLKKKIPSSKSFNYTSEFTSKFIEFESVIAQYSLLNKSFGGTITVPDIQHPYCYTRNDGGDDVVPLSQVHHLVVLYSDYAEPVSVDMESKMVESGLASVQLCDYRNFCHGRFAFVGNHIGREKEHLDGDTAVVILSSPRLQPIADKVREILPPWCPIITITTEHKDSYASIDLLAKSSLFYIDFALAKNVKKTSRPSINKH